MGVWDLERESRFCSLSAEDFDFSFRLLLSSSLSRLVLRCLLLLLCQDNYMKPLVLYNCLVTFRDDWIVLPSPYDLSASAVEQQHQLEHIPIITARVSYIPSLCLCLFPSPFLFPSPVLFLDPFRDDDRFDGGRSDDTYYSDVDLENGNGT